ncbi:MAG: hypothetical protein PSN04_06490 [Methyloprofundus sp.]|nr:hypothetical protein [Methyloprofundus sp.]
MSAYKTSQKVRYTTSIIFIVFMAFIVGGTLLSQPNQTSNESSAISLN